jgi:hypothetical protein
LKVAAHVGALSAAQSGNTPAAKTATLIFIAHSELLPRRNQSDYHILNKDRLSDVRHG